MHNDVLQALLDSLMEPIVFADRNHVIIYMNTAGCMQHARRGGAALVGTSLLACHNETSGQIIREICSRMEQGLDEECISCRKNRRIYMRAVRDSTGEFVGYYERYEKVEEEE